MRKLMPAGELARDERFTRITIEDAIFDPRNAFVSTKPRTNGSAGSSEYLSPSSCRRIFSPTFVAEEVCSIVRPRLSLSFFRNSPRVCFRESV